MEELAKTSAKRVVIQGDVDLEGLEGIRDLRTMDRSVSFRQSWLESVRDTFERLRRENLDRFDLEQEKLRKLLS